MNQKKQWLLWIKNHLSQIHLVDGFLIVIMIILTAQMTITLFSSGEASDSSTSIDIIVRSTAASIFGYFISVNFLKRPTEAEQTNTFATNSTPTITATSPKETTLKGQIGFSESNSQALEPIILSPPPNTPPSFLQSSYLQISIVGVFSIAFLLILLVSRNHPSVGQESVASLSQVRAFVCTGVGFLLGTPSAQAK